MAPGKPAASRGQGRETVAGQEVEGKLYYVCPMPEHVDVLHDGPGKCPICGTDLVPARRRRGRLELPPVAYWVCPMPEHAKFHRSGPGPCPLCGMSLVPVRENPRPPAPPPRGGAKPGKR